LTRVHVLFFSMAFEFITKLGSFSRNGYLPNKERLSVIVII
jgi:hypothetical protein